MQFGVGDVYFIAGQSNAAGFNYPNGTLGSGNNFPTDFPKSSDPVVNRGDATIPYASGTSSNFRARVYNLNGKYEWHAGWVTNVLEETNAARRNASIDGIPYVGGFEEFINGTNKETNPVRIYPNGMASWNWAPLAHRLANNTDTGLKRTPSLFFNVAYPGAALEGFSDKGGDNLPTAAEGKKMYQTMALFGNIFGAKAVLWHQGEENSNRYLGGNSTSVTNYATNLQNVINLSRKALNDNLSSPKLAWYVSQASYLTSTFYSNASSNGFTVSGISGNARSGINTSYKLSSLTNQQSLSSLINSSQRVYNGISTDDLTGTTRDSDLYLHFSGSSTLNTVADRWYDKIKANYPAGGVEPTPMVAISYVEKSGNNYTITVDKNPGTSGTDGKNYYWTINNKGLLPGYRDGFTNVNYYTFTSSSGSDILTCYVEDNNGRFYACQPFIVGDPNAKFIQSTKSSFAFAASGGTDITKVTSQNLDWEVQSGFPSWISLDYNEDNLNMSIIAANNTSSSSRSGNIVLQEVGGGTTKILTVTQSGTGGGCSNTSLTTLTPTNSSSEWTPWSSAKFNGQSINGTTMQVSGVQYSQGIGIHANSRIVYNLGGAYTTFTGLVGRDDGADNDWDGGKVVFSVKTDGVTVWSSSVHGNTSGAESFSIPVSGKNTLELIVDKHTDENYGDHANWMNVNLSCGSGGGCTNAAPTGVSASPPSFYLGGGSTTLSASCASGSTVQWSGSVGSGSPKTVSVSTTTTYTAKCVSASCGDSPTVSVTVPVSSNPPPTGCSTITNNLVMGTWSVTGHELVAKQFHGQWWLVQRINNSPETFLVRGSSMLTRGDVILNNSSYSSMVNCFAWTYSNYGGLAVPSSSEFATPAGYTLSYEPEGTPYYTASGTPPSGCTNAYLTNSWTYASSGYNPPPKIGLSVDGNNMTMGSVNYSSSYPGTGIGTHATSEIIYDLGASHSYQYFKATVGKDNEAFCGENRLLFKVVNNANGAVLATSPTLGNPANGLPQTADMSVSITGIRYLKLVVEDGGDNIYCDHANWARARLACTSSGRLSAKDSLAPLFTIYPNVSNGEFTVDVNLDDDGEYSLDLISSSGAVYKQEKHRGKKGQNAVQFKTGHVQSGLYLLRVTTKDRLETKTVVIEK